MGAENTVNRDTAKVWSAIKELSAHVDGKFLEIRAYVDGQIQNFMTILTGVDGTNGIRGELKDLRRRQEQTDKDVKELEDWGKETVNDLWHTQRPLNCIGKKAVDELRAEEEKKLDVILKTIEKLDSKIEEKGRERRQTMVAIWVAIIAAFASVASSFVSRDQPLVKLEATRYPDQSTGGNE